MDREPREASRQLGAVVGPSLAGWLIAAGFDRPVYFAVLALPMLLGVASLFCLRSLDSRAAPAMIEPAIEAA